jgi:hypothetical protein
MSRRCRRLSVCPSWLRSRRFLFACRRSLSVGRLLSLLPQRQPLVGWPLSRLSLSRPQMAHLLVLLSPLAVVSGSFPSFSWLIAWDGRWPSGGAVGSGG